MRWHLGIRYIFDTLLPPAVWDVILLFHMYPYKINKLSYIMEPY